MRIMEVSHRDLKPNYKASIAKTVQYDIEIDLQT